MSDDTSKILDGSNTKADARLIRDVLAADTADVPEGEDMFDGGCPADVLPRQVPGAPKAQSFTDIMCQVAACNARGDVYQTLSDSIMKAWDRAAEAHLVAVSLDTSENSTTTRRLVKGAEGYRDGIRAALQIVMDAWHADNERRSKA
ncbi:MAG: hypothetical protein EBR82_60010 [Caulobacteraceae bacterium]|nr:hypothetical protein [Caulobacteraceae bacterium]